MGPIDYVVLEWAGDQPVTGEVMPLLLDLVDRGIIRILDLAFLVKAEDGSVAAIDLAEVERTAGASPSSRARPPACSARTTWRRPPPRWSRAPSPACSCGRTAGRRPSPSRCAAPAASSSPAAASPSRPSSRRSTRPKPPPEERGTPCPDCFAASSAPPPSPAPPPRSATACRAARVSAGPSRSARLRRAGADLRRPRPRAARGTGGRPDPPAQGARGPQGAGHPHRRGVRGSEGEDPRKLTRSSRGLWPARDFSRASPAG